jgi:hypothetical protein
MLLLLALLQQQASQQHLGLSLHLQVVQVQHLARSKPTMSNRSIRNSSSSSTSSGRETMRRQQQLGQGEEQQA